MLTGDLSLTPVPFWSPQHAPYPVGRRAQCLRNICGDGPLTAKGELNTPPRRAARGRGPAAFQMVAPALLSVGFFARDSDLRRRDGDGFALAEVDLTEISVTALHNGCQPVICGVPCDATQPTPWASRQPVPLHHAPSARGPR